MRKPGILTLHSVTTANALHFAFQQTHDDATRRFLLLQAAAFSSMFRKRAGADKGAAIDTFEPADGDFTVDEVFAEVGANKTKAAQKALRIYSPAARCEASSMQRSGDLLEGDGLARLQVQQRGARGLLRAVAGAPRSVSRRERPLAQGFDRPGQRAHRPHAGGVGVSR